MPKKEGYQKGMTQKEAYSKAMKAVEDGLLGYAEKLAKEIKDKELTDKIYGKAAMKALEDGWLDSAKWFAEKAGEYLKQNHPSILADIYDRTGYDEEFSEKTGLTDIRKRLERESKGKGKKK